MPTLWQAYAQSGDATLVKYADDLHTKYFDGELPANFDHVELMRRLKAKFDYLVSRGTYGALSPEQEQIIALKAELEQVSGETLRLSKKIASQAKTDNLEADDDQGQDNAGNHPNKRGRQRSRKDKSNRQAPNEDEEWKKVPPKQGEPETKKVDDTEWFWCREHKAWSLHATKDCRVKKAREEREKQNTQPAVAKEAVTASQTHTNENSAAVLATLAQMAMQEE